MSVLSLTRFRRIAFQSGFDLNQKLELCRMSMHPTFPIVRKRWSCLRHLLASPLDASYNLKSSWNEFQIFESVTDTYKCFEQYIEFSLTVQIGSLLPLRASSSFFLFNAGNGSTENANNIRQKTDRQYYTHLNLKFLKWYEIYAPRLDRKTIFQQLDLEIPASNRKVVRSSRSLQAFYLWAGVEYIRFSTTIFFVKLPRSKKTVFVVSSWLCRDSSSTCHNSMF